jgi:hypothetical protein
MLHLAGGLELDERAADLLLALTRRAAQHAIDLEALELLAS